MCPLVYVVRIDPDGDWYKEQQNERHRSGARLECATDDDTPRAACQVLQHEHAKTADPDPAPEDKPEQPRPQSLFGVEIEPDRPNDGRDATDTESDGSPAVDHIRRSIIF